MAQALYSINDTCLTSGIKNYALSSTKDGSLQRESNPGLLITSLALYALRHQRDKTHPRLGLEKQSFRSSLLLGLDTV